MREEFKDGKVKVFTKVLSLVESVGDNGSGLRLRFSVSGIHNFPGFHHF